MKILYDSDTRLKLQIVKLGVNFAVIDDFAFFDLIDSVLVFINTDETRALSTISVNSVL